MSYRRFYQRAQLGSWENGQLSGPEELRAHYRDRNLLEVAVTARHAAEAIAFFAEGRTPTTGAALTVDGGHKETFYR